MKKISSNILFAVLATIVTHADAASKMPPINPGMWEVNMTMDGKKMPSVKQCQTPKTIAEAEKMSDEQNKKACTNIKEGYSGNVYTFEAACAFQKGKTSHIKSEVTMLSVNELRSKTTTTQASKTEVMEGYSKRLGDCPTKGGGTVIQGPDGKSIAIDDLMKQLEAGNAKHKH
ncbi:MAG: DUF3617 family protein [Methylotenera sp.]|nr:DUF3617 family protein [Methylotenera sp.]